MRWWTKRIGATALLLLLCAQVASAACREDRVDLRSNGVEVAFNVAIADEPDERARGLMFVESMPQFDGMLFIYEAPTVASFWMRNTLIPLDMLFIDPQGVVQRIHENAIPLDETAIPGGDNVLAVLEINGGMSAMLGLSVGTEIRHTAFGSDAAWPCE
ncbi:MAG: DUF192 domain-containing protein [Pseudomonadota bacterium]